MSSQRLLSFLLITFIWFAAGQVTGGVKLRGDSATTLALTATPLAPTLAPSPTPIGSAIRYDEPVTDELNALSTTRLYLLQGRGGDLIIVSMERIDGVIDPLVMIIDSKLQNVLAVDNDSGAERNARLRFVLPADGTYVIKATSAQQGDLNGSYRLMVTLANPTATPAPQQTVAPEEAHFAPLTPGIIHGTLTRDISFRAYAFNLQPGDNFRVTPSTGGELQIGLYLFTPTMREIARAELGAPMAFVAANTASYILIVSRINGNGRFTLDATLPDHSPVPLGSERLIPGQRQEGTIGSLPGALYVFDALPGTRFDLSLNGPDLVVVLASPNFDEVAFSATGAIRDVLLREGGTYTLLIMHQGGVNAFQPTPYTLTFRGEIDPDQVPTATPTLAPTVTATPVGSDRSPTSTDGAGAGDAFPQINYGSTLVGALDAVNPRLYYRFRGQAGDRVSLKMAPLSDSALEPVTYLYFYGQNPPLLIVSAAGIEGRALDAVIPGTTLPYSGIYVIIATSKGGTAGRFTLELMRSG